ncbi:MAG: MtrB/PioB family decaheme-associated outer membrane protein [Nitrospinota bacterium]|nr:MtrB/PioB family decaheme-associated outer membrane protein [Nitrospinota bacterium]
MYKGNEKNMILEVSKRFIVLFFFLFAIAALPAVSMAQEEDAAEEEVVADEEADAEEDTEEEADAEEEDEYDLEPVLDIHVMAGGDLVSIDAPSYKFGEYNGVTEEGFHPNAEFKLIKENRGFYIDLRGKDLLLHNRRVYLELGQAWKYSFFVRYDQTPHMISNNSKTFHAGEGTNALTLPASYTRGTDPSDVATALAGSIADANLELGRDDMQYGFSVPWKKLRLDFTARSETKKGTQSLGSVVGSWAPDRRGIDLPMPIDYKTDEMTTTIGYQSKMANVRVSMFSSNFTNNNTTLTWDNPFSVGPDTAVTALDPNNTATRTNISAGLRLPGTTRVSLIYETGVMKQDETLLPYSNNSDQTDITAALPRSTAEAEIDTTTMILSASTRPITPLTLALRYKSYTTENKTTKSLFQYVRNDGTDQASVTDSWALYNLPYDYTQSKMDMDVTYNIFSRTNLKLSYITDGMERTNREIKKTTETTLKAGLNSQFGTNDFLRLNYASSSRKADDAYNTANVYNAVHTSQYIATQSDYFDNNPLMRKFDIADRDRTKYGAKVILNPIEIATVGFFYNFWADDYASSELGLKSTENQQYSVDFAVLPTEEITLTAFYSTEENKAAQASRYILDALKGAQYNDVTRDWNANHYDLVPTLGFGARMKLMGEKLELDFNYTTTTSTTSIQIGAGSEHMVPTQLPDLTTSLTSYELVAKYGLTDSLSLGVGYKNEEFKSEDWATKGIDPLSGIMPQVLTMTGSTPDYQGSLILLTVNYASF